MQADLLRNLYEALSIVQNNVDDDVQEVDFINYHRVGDQVNVIVVDALGNPLSTLASQLSILSVNTGTNKLVLSASVDTTAYTPGNGELVIIQNTTIKTGFAAIHRLYEATPASGAGGFALSRPILASELNTPSAGQTTFEIADGSFIEVGDVIDTLADSGLVEADSTVLSVSINADDDNNRTVVVIDELVDLTAETNPILIDKSITTQEATLRLHKYVEKIDQPVRNEDLTTLNGAPDASFSVFETVNLFINNSSSVFLDIGRLFPGNAGTLASYTHGAGTSELAYTSMITGSHGDDTEVEVTAGAGIVVSVTGNFNSGYTVSVTNNAGAATAKEIAEAINADATARRIVQVIYGGGGRNADGSGTVATLVPTNLAGANPAGMTGDYAEIEQVFRNERTQTGYKFIALRIAEPGETNIMSKPPKGTESLHADYTRPMVNIDY